MKTHTNPHHSKSHHSNPHHKLQAPPPLSIPQHSPPHQKKNYALQAQYSAKIDDLQKQLQDLIAKRDADIRGVLTADQQKKLDEALGDTTKAKSSKKSAADSKNSTPPATDMKKSNS